MQSCVFDRCSSKESGCSSGDGRSSPPGSAYGLTVFFARKRLSSSTETMMWRNARHAAISPLSIFLRRLLSLTLSICAACFNFTDSFFSSRFCTDFVGADLSSATSSDRLFAAGRSWLPVRYLLLGDRLLMRIWVPVTTAGKSGRSAGFQAAETLADDSKRASVQFEKKAGKWI